MSAKLDKAANLYVHLFQLTAWARQKRSILVFIISKNKIGPSGAEDLEALALCPYLEVLDLSHNHLGDSVRSSIDTFRIFIRVFTFR